MQTEEQVKKNCSSAEMQQMKISVCYQSEKNFWIVIGYIKKSGKMNKHLENLHSERRRRVWSFLIHPTFFGDPSNTIYFLSVFVCGAVTP